ncbi:MAG: hypothetical protein A2015_15455 [Spirochaetes bacterium GWF1_31_7]|nr:MAG: hypothetical protein A2Y30_11875 [Spirochaetes bacterium GWE1_32_154]OHD47262.1 MAG: hypothetical protein A2Y29_02890 [Spirochaetes bacterium GWE2_31_10]OHD52134.1 MAG: hypothetical protein A2015_15455 [Spirochaetes bacterium GWF1_31_7]OHD83000.1 MAG: hypothetical protein A2355_10390 [Spirochaetes bacterium RIFOXYB1_FULL_32_8]HBD96318.1 hypothetical protein [Spirochaetia bacterium]
MKFVNKIVFIVILITVCSCGFPVVEKRSEIEDNNIKELYTEITNDGLIINGSISNVDDVDYYRFTAGIGVEYTIKFKSINQLVARMTTDTEVNLGSIYPLEKEPYYAYNSFYSSKSYYVYISVSANGDESGDYQLSVTGKIGNDVYNY